jgi:hypothetical protein
MLGVFARISWPSTLSDAPRGRLISSSGSWTVYGTPQASSRRVMCSTARRSSSVPDSRTSVENSSTSAHASSTRTASTTSSSRGTDVTFVVIGTSLVDGFRQKPCRRDGYLQGSSRGRT